MWQQVTINHSIPKRCDGAFNCLLIIGCILSIGRRKFFGRVCLLVIIACLKTLKPVIAGVPARFRIVKAAIDSSSAVNKRLCALKLRLTCGEFGLTSEVCLFVRLKLSPAFGQLVLGGFELVEAVVVLFGLILKSFLTLRILFLTVVQSLFALVIVLCTLFKGGETVNISLLILGESIQAVFQRGKILVGLNALILPIGFALEHIGKTDAAADKAEDRSKNKNDAKKLNRTFHAFPPIN